MSFVVLGRKYVTGESVDRLGSWSPTLEKALSKLADDTIGIESEEDSLYRAIALRDVNPTDGNIQTALLVDRWTSIDSPEGTLRYSGRCVMHLVSRSGFGVALSDMVVGERANGPATVCKISSLEDQISLGIIAMDALSSSSFIATEHQGW